MWLDTSKSNLTEINNSDDTLHVKNYLSSPDTNKHQKDIDNEKQPLNFHQQIYHHQV